MRTPRCKCQKSLWRQTLVWLTRRIPAPKRMAMKWGPKRAPSFPLSFSSWTHFHTKSAKAVAKIRVRWTRAFRGGPRWRHSLGSLEGPSYLLPRRWASVIAKPLSAQHVPRCSLARLALRYVMLPVCVLIRAYKCPHPLTKSRPMFYIAWMWLCVTVWKCGFQYGIHNGLWQKKIFLSMRSRHDLFRFIFRFAGKVNISNIWKKVEFR